MSIKHKGLSHDGDYDGDSLRSFNLFQSFSIFNTSVNNRRIHRNESPLSQRIAVESPNYQPSQTIFEMFKIFCDALRLSFSRNESQMHRNDRQMNPKAS